MLTDKKYVYISIRGTMAKILMFNNIRAKFTTFLVITIFGAMLLSNGSAFAEPVSSNIKMWGEATENANSLIDSGFRLSDGRFISTSESGFDVVNQGSENITSIQFSADLTNFTLTAVTVDTGSIDANTLIWTGSLNPSSSMQIQFEGFIAGDIDQIMSVRFDAVSSTLIGDVENEEDTSDNFVHQDFTIIEAIDLNLESRLLTTGEKNVGDTISYELTVSNVGNLSFTGAHGLMLFFVVPNGSEYINITDLDTGDGYSTSPCYDMDDDSTDMFPGLAAYHARVILCGFSGDSYEFLPGASTRVQIDFVLSQEYISGQSVVRGLLDAEGEDDSAFIRAIVEGGNPTDPFTLDNNNAITLAFSNDPLLATINRCNGYAAEVSTDEACFTVTFNKTIYAPSFTQSDLVLEGNGSIFAFEQINSNQWQVKINGMTFGTTLKLRLDTDAVVDYSVHNSAQVLGENVIRFGPASAGNDTSNDTANENGRLSGAKPANSASGTLAETGSSTSTNIATSVVFVFIGLLLAIKYRKVA